MISLVDFKSYRDDIDGVRAISVLAVLLFHFGYIKNGYLGVDVFFVISGYLITGIIYRELQENHFSMINFYLRRIRRIIPLALFIALTALTLGIAFMLPDDLENLAQSIVATNLFSNNILQALTVKNYWDVQNDFKPLLHTWSLGIEEQYYFLYPFIFMIIGKTRKHWFLPVLIILTIASLLLYCSAYDEYVKFYLIPFRFYELSIGGVAAVALNGKIVDNKFSSLLVLILIGLLFFDIQMPKQLLQIVTVVIAVSVLISANNKHPISRFILQNDVMVALGTISFSIYMWHQILLSFTRYFIIQDLHSEHIAAIFVLTIILSLFSYALIEQPFRNKKTIPVKPLLIVLGIIFAATNLTSLYIYYKAGVLKDIPELDIVATNASRNMHSVYNGKIYDYDKDFRDLDKINVLVLGNSFARDWANVLLESKYKDSLEISYIYNVYSHKNLQDRADKADIIFFSTPNHEELKKFGIDKVIDERKFLAIGTKSFGTSNGVFYNYSDKNTYYQQRTTMENGFVDLNNSLQAEWKNKYLNLIAKIIDENQTVPVFTPDNKFISQDCRHLTKAGARYFAKLFENDLEHLLKQVEAGVPLTTPN